MESRPISPLSSEASDIDTLLSPVPKKPSMSHLIVDESGRKFWPCAPDGLIPNSCVRSVVKPPKPKTPPPRRKRWRPRKPWENDVESGDEELNEADLFDEDEDWKNNAFKMDSDSSAAPTPISPIKMEEKVEEKTEQKTTPKKIKPIFPPIQQFKEAAQTVIKKEAVIKIFKKPTGPAKPKEKPKRNIRFEDEDPVPVKAESLHIPMPYKKYHEEHWFPPNTEYKSSAVVQGIIVKLQENVQPFVMRDILSLIHDMQGTVGISDKDMNDLTTCLLTFLSHQSGQMERTERKEHDIRHYAVKGLCGAGLERSDVIIEMIKTLEDPLVEIRDAVKEALRKMTGIENTMDIIEKLRELGMFMETDVAVAKSDTQNTLDALRQKMMNGDLNSAQRARQFFNGYAARDARLSGWLDDMNKSMENSQRRALKRQRRSPSRRRSPSPGFTRARSPPQMPSSRTPLAQSARRMYDEDSRNSGAMHSSTPLDSIKDESTIAIRKQGATPPTNQNVPPPTTNEGRENPDQVLLEPSKEGTRLLCDPSRSKRALHASLSRNRSMNDMQREQRRREPKPTAQHQQQGKAMGNGKKETAQQREIRDQNNTHTNQKGHQVKNSMKEDRREVDVFSQQIKQRSEQRNQGANEDKRTPQKKSKREAQQGRVEETTEKLANYMEEYRHKASPMDPQAKGKKTDRVVDMSFVAAGNDGDQDELVDSDDRTAVIGNVNSGNRPRPDTKDLVMKEPTRKDPNKENIPASRDFTNKDNRFVPTQNSTGEDSAVTASGDTTRMTNNRVSTQPPASRRTVISPTDNTESHEKRYSITADRRHAIMSQVPTATDKYWDQEGGPQTCIKIVPAISNTDLVADCWHMNKQLNQQDNIDFDVNEYIRQKAPTVAEKFFKLFSIMNGTKKDKWLMTELVEFQDALQLFKREKDALDAERKKRNMKLTKAEERKMKLQKMMEAQNEKVGNNSTVADNSNINHGETVDNEEEPTANIKSQKKKPVKRCTKKKPNDTKVCPPDKSSLDNSSVKENKHEPPPANPLATVEKNLLATALKALQMKRGELFGMANEEALSSSLSEDTFSDICLLMKMLTSQTNQSSIDYDSISDIVEAIEREFPRYLARNNNLPGGCGGSVGNTGGAAELHSIAEETSDMLVTQEHRQNLVRTPILHNMVPGVRGERIARTLHFLPSVRSQPSRLPSHQADMLGRPAQGVHGVVAAYSCMNAPTVVEKQSSVMHSIPERNGMYTVCESEGQAKYGNLRIHWTTLTPSYDFGASVPRRRTTTARNDWEIPPQASRHMLYHDELNEVDEDNDDDELMCGRKRGRTLPTLGGKKRESCNHNKIGPGSRNRLNPTPISTADCASSNGGSHTKIYLPKIDIRDRLMTKQRLCPVDT